MESMNVKVKNVIEALSAIDNQDDLSAIAKAWKMQMNYIANMNKATVKVVTPVNRQTTASPERALFKKLIVQLSML